MPRLRALPSKARGYRSVLGNPANPDGMRSQVARALLIEDPMGEFQCVGSAEASHQILIVEDDRDMRMLLAEVLMDEDRLLVLAEDRAGASTAMGTAGPFALGLFDDQLPDGCGLDLLEDFRADNPAAECIVMTAHAHLESAVRALRLGAFDFVQKPLEDLGAFGSLVSSALGKVDASMQRRTMQQRLERSEERYALAARAARDGLWDWDLESNFVYFSERWKTLLGLDTGEVGNSLDEWFARVCREDLPALQEAIAAQLSGESDYFEQEYRIRDRQGEYRWVCTRGACERAPDGRAYRMAGSLSDVTDRKLAEHELRVAAMHDPLTALPNRVLFTERLDGCLRAMHRDGSCCPTVLFIDLDRFKRVNDSLGHDAGDELLVAVARRMQGCLRDTDTLARLGGDEFAVLLPDLADASQISCVEGRLRASVTEPVVVHGHEVVVGASVGIAVANDSYRDSKALLRDADIAMYRVKAAGGDAARMFEPSMQSAAAVNVRLETDLRRALACNELQLRYQPIVSIDSSIIVGFEALIRWEHAEQGWIAPDSLVSLAEQAGLVNELGAWTVQEACRQVSRWRASSGRSLFISVNVSPLQFDHPAFVDGVRDALGACGLPASELRLEITEGVFIGDFDRAAATLAVLRDLGVRVSLDDFGTGYSSLAYLHHLPIDSVKVDRSFVSQADERAASRTLVGAIITMAHALGMEVVAEGIETQRQATLLHRMGCDYGQGFHYSRAATESEVQGLLGLGPSLVSVA